jgi:tyrosyl-DNA phosphodiesterase 2
MLPALLRKQLSFVPEAQPFHTFLDGAWRPATQTTAITQGSPLTSLSVMTWNIDFMASHPQARMASAVSYLERLVLRVPSTSAVVIFLQEMQEVRFPRRLQTSDAEDLTQLTQAPWVQQRFHMTDLDLENWKATYGQVTLIDRRLRIAEVSRLHFVSEFNRDALLVDIPLAGQENGLLRLCNVHLDSMQGSMRPVQWKGVAKYLQDKAAGVTASVLAGDCNANQKRDRTEPQDNGFRDAYLELGGTESDEEGATWGFQSKDWERWGRSRLDKIVYWGGIDIKSLKRIGVGVKVEDEEIAKAMEDDEELPFVTDHYGLMSEFTVESGLGTVETGDTDHDTGKKPSGTDG